MGKIDLLIRKLEEARGKYGDVLQKPATSQIVELLNAEIQRQYNIELSSVYKTILLKTNGFNENGVFLYGAKTKVIEGHSNRYLEGIIEANEIWHENETFSDYLFYAESDMYLFVQSLKTQLFSCRVRDGFKELVYETSIDSDFFEKIFQLAIEDDYSLG